MVKLKRSGRKVGRNPSSAALVLGYALAGVGVYVLYRKWKGLGADPDPARAAIEKAVGPMVEPAPTTPGSPTNFPGWWRNYTPPQGVPEPGQFSPVTGERIEPTAGFVANYPPPQGSLSPLQEKFAREKAVEAEMQAKYGPGLVQAQPSLATSLMTADVSRAIVSQKPVDVSQMVMASRAPSALQADPGMSERMRSEQRAVEAERSLRADIAGAYTNAVKKGAVSDDFMRALKSKTGEYHPITSVQGQTSIGPKAAAEAIALGFYAKVDASTGDPGLQKQQTALSNLLSNMSTTDPRRAVVVKDLQSVNNRLANMEGRSLKEYQDAYTKQAKLEAELKRTSPSDSNYSNLSRQLAKVSQKVSDMNAKAQTAYKQAVEIKTLDAKQADDKRQIERQIDQFARERGYVNPDGTVNISDPAARAAVQAAVANMNLKHSVERQRLKEQQMGVGEGRGRDNASESAAAARAGAKQAEERTEAARQVSYDRDVAEEMVKQAVREGKYAPASGESFEDSVRKELATGNIGSQNAAMRAEAEKRVQKMRDDAAKAQQQAVKEAASPLAKARALPPVAPRQISVSSISWSRKGPRKDKTPPPEGGGGGSDAGYDSGYTSSTGSSQGSETGSAPSVPSSVPVPSTPVSSQSRGEQVESLFNAPRPSAPKPSAPVYEEE